MILIHSSSSVFDKLFSCTAQLLGEAVFEGKRLQLPPALPWLCQHSWLPGEEAEGQTPGLGLVCSGGP